MGKSRHNYLIREPEDLSAVLRDVRDRFSSEDKAADALGIPQSMFSRLLYGKQTRIRSDNFKTIREALGGNLFDLDPMEAFKLNLQGRFEESVVPFLEVQVRAVYEAWVRREHERLESKVRMVFAELRSQPECSAAINLFCERVTGRREFPPRNNRRVWLAIYRALEPLADAQATEKVERTWQELRDAGELRPYVAAGLKREQTMLHREHDLERIRKAGVSEEFAEALAGE